MDWLYILMPISGVTIFWPGLVILGVGVGIIGGFFGMGGAWMVTPGLNILGFPMAFAIGTDISHMAGKSLISTMRHGKFGNVDYTLGLIMLVGTILGFEVGAQIVLQLERIGNLEKVVRWIYIALLAFIAWTVFADVAKRKRKEAAAAAKGEQLDAGATGIEWHKTLHKMKIPPMMHFKAPASPALRGCPFWSAFSPACSQAFWALAAVSSVCPLWFTWLAARPTWPSAPTSSRWLSPVCTAQPPTPSRAAPSWSPP